MTNRDTCEMGYYSYGLLFDILLSRLIKKMLFCCIWECNIFYKTCCMRIKYEIKQFPFTNFLVSDQSKQNISLLSLQRVNLKAGSEFHKIECRLKSPGIHRYGNILYQTIYMAWNTCNLNFGWAHEWILSEFLIHVNSIPIHIQCAFKQFTNQAIWRYT